MIALYETNEYAAEIPFTLPLASDPLTGLTGWSFTLGEVQIKLPDSAFWINVAVGKIVEKGYGRFAARLTAAQTATAGIVTLRATVTGAQPFFGYETIGVLGGDIPVEEDGQILFYLPDEVDPINNPAIDDADFTLSGTLRICLPDDTYRDCTFGEKSAVINLGYGGYALPINSTLTTKAGKVYIRAEYTGAQSFESYATILGAGVAEDPDPTPPTPVETTAASTVLEALSPIKNLILGGVVRLPEYAKSGDYVDEPFLDNVGFDYEIEGGLG